MARKTALITGSTSGIGLAGAEALAHKGWRVFVHGRSASRLGPVVEALRAKVPHGEFEGVTGDLSSLASVADLAAQVKTKATSLDALWNNAGGMQSSFAVTVDGIERQMAVNFIAPFVLSRLLLPLLRAAPQGRIVDEFPGPCLRPSEDQRMAGPRSRAVPPHGRLRAIEARHAPVHRGARQADRRELPHGERIPSRFCEIGIRIERRSPEEGQFRLRILRRAFTCERGRNRRVAHRRSGPQWIDRPLLGQPAPEETLLGRHTRGSGAGMGESGDGSPRRPGRASDLSGGNPMLHILPNAVPLLRGGAGIKASLEAIDDHVIELPRANA